MRAWEKLNYPILHQLYSRDHLVLNYIVLITLIAGHLWLSYSLLPQNMFCVTF